MKFIGVTSVYLHCVQTDPAKNVWTCAYLIPERSAYLILERGNLAIEQKPNAGCLDAQTWVKLNAPDTYHQEHTYQHQSPKHYW
jgi:hypothetical protein